MTLIHLISKRVLQLVLTAALVVSSGGTTKAQSIAPAYAGKYSLISFGAVPGVPGTDGGLTFMAGNPNTLLIGGNANSSTGGIYSIGVVRGAGGHITGFAGSATLFATAPNIDGGLAYGPGGVLFYTSWPNDTVGEVKPGSSVTDKTVSLSPLGISSSPGGLGFVPGSGAFKIASYSGSGFYDVPLIADGSGTYNLGPATLTASGLSGPEGFIYPNMASPLFSSPSILLSEFNSARVSAFQVDSSGNPITASRQDFIASLGSAEGATFDPLTGDALFSTWSGNKLIEVRGFAAVPEPSSLMLAGLGLGGLFVAALVRRNRGARLGGAHSAVLPSEIACPGFSRRRIMRSRPTSTSAVPAIRDRNYASALPALS